MAAYVLPFEKPVVELVTRVKELRELAQSDRHFEPEQRPEFDMAPAAQAHHAEVMARINQVLMRETATAT